MEIGMERDHDEVLRQAFGDLHVTLMHMAVAEERDEDDQLRSTITLDAALWAFELAHAPYKLGCLHHEQLDVLHNIAKGRNVLGFIRKVLASEPTPTAATAEKEVEELISLTGKVYRN